MISSSSIDIRIEKKVRLPSKQLARLLQNPIFQRMRRLHETRRVTSVYYDTPSLENFYQTVEGVVPRSKFRYRWYDDNVTLGQIERKIRTPSDSHKIIKTNIFQDEEAFNLPALTQKFLSSYPGNNLIPALQVNYLRQYFQIASGVRLTIDTNIIFQSKNANLLRKPKSSLLDNILEFKVQNVTELSYLAPEFGVSFTRFSKYETGVVSLLPTV